MLAVDVPHVRDICYNLMFVSMTKYVVEFTLFCEYHKFCSNNALIFLQNALLCLVSPLCKNLDDTTFKLVVLTLSSLFFQGLIFGDTTETS